MRAKHNTGINMMDVDPLQKPLRILAVSQLDLGRNDYAFVQAFRRLGHSVSVVSADNYVPRWKRRSLRALRRLLSPVFVAEYNRMLMREAEYFQPELFFVFKGTHVTPEAMKAIKAGGALAINFYPDTGFADHGPYLEKTIGLFDWVFTTKPAGVADLKENYDLEMASFIPHAFDPEVHSPTLLSTDDLDRYQCDVSFIGNKSKKKQQVIDHIRRALPDVRMRIWGPPAWYSVPDFHDIFEGIPVWGKEYAKAILASKINLGPLYEGGASAPEPDLITARTFEIPATGGFMLHERTKEAMKYFEDGKECAFYSDPDDLVDKIRYYLDNPGEREKITRAGRERCLNSGYSVDDRVKTVLDKFAEFRAVRGEKD
jgi:hypothetical protein